MADLSNFFQVAPTTASMFMGRQFAQEREMEALKQQELANIIAQRQAQEARNSELHPFELEQRRLANEQTGAQIPGIQAESTLKGYKARMAGETYDTDVKTAKAKSQGDYEEEQVKRAQKVHEFLTSASPELEQIPPPLRGQYFRSRIEASGFDPNSPQVQRTMQMVGLDPEGAPARLRQESEKLGKLLAQRTSAYQQAAETSASHERVAAGNNRTQKEITQMNIEAGRWNKSARGGSAQDQLEKALVSGSWDKAATAYDYMAQEAAMNGDQQQAIYYQQKAKEYADKFLQSRSGGSPRAGSLDMGQVTDMPTNPAPTTQAPSLPTQKGTKENPIVLK
jgi:hypothetical protein